jgi:hypothetical protein
MRLRPSIRLGTLALIGLILFVITNWWPLFTGQDDSNEVITATTPEISKSAAIAAAESHISRVTGIQAKGAMAVYESDKLSSSYVQKQHLQAEYLSKFASTLPLDYYRVELKDGGGSLRYLVDVDMTSGNVLGWQSRSEQPAPSAREGGRIAENYLQQSGKSLSGYEMLLPNPSTPYRFVFERRGVKLGQAQLQDVVEVRGGQVTAFRTELRIPADHIRWVERQDRAAEKMTGWNLILSGLMGLAAVILSIVNRKRIAFARGICLTICFMLLYWINNFNMLPAFKTLASDQADPFISNESAMGMIIVMNIVVATLGILAYVSFSAGQAIWDKEQRPIWMRWREHGFGRDTFDSMKRGYLLAFFILGVQSLLFFIAEQRFDMWAVNDPSGSLYNFIRPELFPLMAWTAAISEESVYRFFGIALFKKMLNNTFIAVLIPSLIWAFSHTQYPIYPVYTRLIEVTILGIIFGYAFLKFGFATVLFAHTVMDSLLMSFNLMSMGGAAHVSLAMLYIALPAFIGWLLSWLHHSYRSRRQAV